MNLLKKENKNKMDLSIFTFTYWHINIERRSYIVHFKNQSIKAGGTGTP